MIKYTQEERAAYSQALRKRWQDAKARAEGVTDTEAFIAAISQVPNMSPYGYFFVKEQMEALGLEGVPGIDARTFKGWRNAGYRVKKGESSRIDGITWVGGKNKDDEGKKDEKSGYVYPKQYHLFHTSQVEPINPETTRALEDFAFMDTE